MQFLLHRFHNQYLAGRQLSRPADLVAHLGAVQSQDYLGAKWSLGQRLQDATDASLDRAFNAGEFLRTHILRPTWHFVTPGDIRWMLALTAPHVHRLNGYPMRRFGLGTSTLRRTSRVLARALAGKNWHTRTEVATRLEADGIAASGPRLAYILMHAELEGLVASGPLKGKHHTYALLDERAPAGTSIGRPEALGRLALRFFTGHGPATDRHFAWWSGLPLRDARTGLMAVRDALTRRTINGTEWLGFAGRTPGSTLKRAYFLPEYDEALTGWRDLGVPDMARTRQRWTDTFHRPILIDGARAGTWRRTFTSAGAVIELNCFTRLRPDHERKLGVAARRYGDFLRVPVSLTPASSR